MKEESREKLWGGRFKEKSSALLERFNASLPFDYRLWSYDILGSKAHSKMLHQIGILSQNDLELIHKGLDEIAQEIESNQFSFRIEDEDIHMAIESALIQKIGDVGKKLHTARSRNDQVALDFRMYVLESSRELQKLLLELISVLLDIAEKHTTTIMPGMTHLQHAQPINFGFHLIAWCANLKRDFERLESSIKRNDYLPLGSGALAGTPYGNDRLMMAKELNFRAPTLNAMDSVSDRDFALDLLYDISMMMMHLSRFAEELILWSSYEFRFVVLSDAYATGSSIMPQKKNPDVPELLRGKSGRSFGNLMSLLTVMKGLPFAYNKDMQEDKERVFDSVETASLCLEIFRELVKTMSVQEQSMEKMAKTGHLTATDLADFLVKECGVPFREAHHITGRVVAYAEEKKKDITELKDQELIKIDPRIKQGAEFVLNLKSSMNARNSLGGTSSKQTQEQIQVLRDWILYVKR